MALGRALVEPFFEENRAVMSLRQTEKILAAPEALSLETRTAFRRTASELLDQLPERSGRLVIDRSGTGADAMKQLDAFTPDILVLDLRLPDTDGIALLQKIRQQSPALPVVVTTAYVSMEPLMGVLDLGHSGYLVKPFDLNDLAARIDAVG